ncbi:MAG: hypothetical protein ACK53L_21235, partial [Pirellulaceae bacterium]
QRLRPTHGGRCSKPASLPRSYRAASGLGSRSPIASHPPRGDMVKDDARQGNAAFLEQPGTG